MRMLQVRVLSLAPFIPHLLYVKSTFTLKGDSLKAEFEVDLITVTTLVKLKVTIIWGVGRVVEGAGLENQ